MACTAGRREAAGGNPGVLRDKGGEADAHRRTHSRERHEGDTGMVPRRANIAARDRYCRHPVNMGKGAQADSPELDSLFEAIRIGK